MHDRDMVMGLDIVNDVVAKKWPYISDWFHNKMKVTLEPLLSNLLEKLLHTKVIDLKLTKCNLGTEPMRLENLQSFKYAQDRKGDEKSRTNILFLGDVTFEGGEVELKAGSVAEVRITSLRLTGRVVIELVRLTDTPPWISGLRAYFPNAPQVEIRLESDVMVVDAFCNTAALLQTRIEEQIKRVIGNAAVLPNCFSLDFCKGADPFQLKHLAPQGALRLQVSKLPERSASEVAAQVGGEAWTSEATEEPEPCTPPSAFGRRKGGTEARGVRFRDSGAAEDGSPRLPTLPESAAAAGAAAGGAAAPAVAPRRPSLWARWFGRAQPIEKEPEISVEVVVGNITQTSALDGSMDFLLLDRERQSVRLRVRDEKGKVLAEEDVGAVQLAERQYFDEDDNEARPSEYPLRAQLENGKNMDLRVLAEWRPCAPSGGIGRALEQGHSARWCLGNTSGASWVLAVELYHATGLPAAASGTQHWATVELRRRSSNEQISLRETNCAPGQRPVDRAFDMVKVLGQFDGRLPAEALSDECNWRKALDLTEPERAPGDSVDVVWDYPLWFLVASGGEPVMEAIKALEIVVTVKRPESTLYRDMQSTRPDKTLGQLTWRLAELVSTDDYSLGVSLPLPITGAWRHAASVRMRLHVRPLLEAPNFRGQGWFYKSRKIKQAISKARTNIARPFKRSVSFVEGARTLYRQMTHDNLNGALRNSRPAQGAMERFSSTEELDAASASQQKEVKAASGSSHRPAAKAGPTTEPNGTNVPATGSMSSPLAAGTAAAAPAPGKQHDGLSEAVRLDLEAAAKAAAAAAQSGERTRPSAQRSPSPEPDDWGTPGAGPTRENTNENT